MSNRILGVDLDRAGRCVHYHLPVDIAAMKCAQCQQYYACYKCHAALTNHPFAPCPARALAVLCGNCGTQMRQTTYEQGACPRCGHAFNPRCAVHREIYFK